MTERTYPREWFEANRWSKEPNPKMFARETEHRLYYTRKGAARFETKKTTYSEWFPTREEAQAVIDEREAAKAEKRRLDRIRDAAPDLFKMLSIAVGVIEASGILWMGVDDAKAALAKARGES